MKSSKKYLEKLMTQSKKNPGQENKARRKEEAKARRGQPIPAPKAIRSKKDKAKSRQSQKQALRKEVGY